MPRRARRSNIKRKPMRKGRKGKTRFPKTATGGSGQRATIVETIELQDLVPNLVKASTFCLSQFPRAATVAANFAFYKAAKVVWNYEPLYNTFQDTAGGASVPYLYTVMNRQQQKVPQNPLIPWDRRNIQATGAMPQKLSKKISVSYRPNWCSPGLSAILVGSNPQQYSLGLKTQYDWLATSGTVIRATTAGGASNLVPDFNPVAIQPITQEDGFPTQLVPVAVATSSVNYNGHLNYIDQEVPGAEETPTCRLTCTVHWIFKGAAFNQSFVSSAPQPVEGA